MDPLTLTAIVFAVVFAGGAIGMELQHVLPESYTTGGVKDMTFAVVGLITLLVALVLGLLIWTAYGVYSIQRASIQTMAISALRFEEDLQDYGREAAEGQQILKAGLKRTIAHIWGGRGDDSNFVIKSFGFALADLKERQVYLNSLEPATDQQRAAKADALQAAAAYGQTRTQMALALVDPVSYPVLGVVVSWAAFLFCGYGLLSRRHVMSYIVLALGAMAIASSIYVIVDLISPYSGLFRVSPAPILDVINAIDEAAAPAGGHR